MTTSNTAPPGALARALALSCLVWALGGCGVSSAPGTSSPQQDGYDDLVVNPSARPLWRSLVAAVPDAGSAPPPPSEAREGSEDDDDRPNLGPIEILLGTEGDRRALPADAIDRFDGGFEGSYLAPGASLPSRLHVVLDAPYQSWADEGTFVHLVVLTPDFQPAAGAEIYLFGQQIGLADAHGAFAFRRAPSDFDGGEGLLVARHEGLTRRVRYRSGARTQSFEATTIYGYTDRGLYQPGDTALFRAIAWRLRGEYVPYASQQLEVQLVGDRDRIVTGAQLRTDDWGIAEAPLPIPATLPDGPYRLKVRAGTEVAESRLVVQRFVAPVIAIEHDLPRYLARTRAELTTQVSLRYFTGAELGSAQLALVAKQGEVELVRTERRVSGPGPHTLQLDAAALERIMQALGGRTALGRRTLGLDLVVTDEHGRTDTIHRFVEVVPNPYLATLELDRTRYQVGDPVQVMVRATERDGVPVRRREVELRLAGAARLTATSDASGVARFTFPMPPRGGLLEAFLSDVRAPVGATTLPVPVSVPMRSAVPSTVVPSGEEIDVRIVFPSDVRPVERVVHADVVDSSGAIIHSSLVPIVEVDGRPEARSRVVAPSWGSMLLTLWCVARRGEAIGVVTDGQSLVVTPGETLTVTLSGLPERAEPGQEIQAAIEVRDQSGALREAMLGVSVADRAVLSLLDPFERAPVDRFYNPERKVLASTGAQTLTWPWVSRTWGEDRVDIGWPGTFGFHAGRDPRPHELSANDAESFEALLGFGTDSIGGNFGFGGFGSLGGLGVLGTGGGGTGAGTIGLGNLGTIGHGAGAGYGRGAGASEPNDAASEPEAEPATTIVLRTVHDENSLWLPRLVAVGGRANLSARLPQSITEEDISVLATDRNGGIALARVHVPIEQPLFARSDLPPSLVEGEELEVIVAAENHGSTPLTLTLSLEALEASTGAPGQLTIVGEPRRGTVRPGGTMTAHYRVLGAAPGTARYRVQAEGPTLTDIDERELHIEARGAPDVQQIRGILEGGSYRTTLTLDPTDRTRQVRMGVTFPTVAPALASLDTLFELAGWGPDPASSQVMGAAAAYRYMVLNGELDAPRREELADRLRAIGVRIAGAQNFDGGFGWHWSNGRSGPFITVHALEAMLELRDVGLFVDGNAISRAAAYLVSSLREYGSFATAEVAPWEEPSPRISLAASVEALHAIARALPPSDPLVGIVRDELYAPRAREVLEAPSPDPLALAHTVAAGVWLGALDREALEDLIPRLADIGAITHWEPGWFDAWGGTVEAAATTLEVLDLLYAGEHDTTRGLVTDARFEGAARDALRYLLHTRRSFGAWHNTRATAWAIRALTRVPPGAADERGTVRVLIDGEERQRVSVDAASVFASALALREIDLSGLSAGEHTLEVHYDGRARPRIDVEVRRWVADASTAPQAAASPSPSPALERQVPAACQRAEACDVSLALPATLRFPALIEQPLGDGFEVDRDALEALVARGDVSWIELTRDLARVAVPSRRTELVLPLRVRRTGELALRPTRASALAGGVVLQSEVATLTAR